MNYCAVTCQEFDEIDFTPTIIVGFYRDTKKDNFAKECIALRERFGDVDIIGCSSESNIYDKTPHIDSTDSCLCTFACLDIDKDAYDVKLTSSNTPLDLDKSKYSHHGAVILSSSHFEKLEDTIESLQRDLGKNSFFGAIASVTDIKTSTAEIYYNGKFYDNCVLLWLIDQERYTLEGMSAHHFQPVGFPMVATKTDGSTIYEIDNSPALDVMEDIIGNISNVTITSFDHPFFLNKNQSSDYANSPLCSLSSMNREKKSIDTYRNIPCGSKLKVGISLNKDDKNKQLARFHRFSDTKGIALLFNCVGIKANLGIMESLYLMNLKQSLKIPFVGFHSFGEIGPASTEEYSVLHNQTISLAVISQKEQTNDAK